MQSYFSQIDEIILPLINVAEISDICFENNEQTNPVCPCTGSLSKATVIQKGVLLHSSTQS